MSIESSVLTSEDIAELNAAAVTRAAWFTRLAGTGLVAVGAAGFAAWVWLEVRVQLRLGATTASALPVSVFSQSTDPVDRIDAFAESIYLALYATVAVGVGVGLRMVADYTVTRTGGSVTGFETGDHVPEGDEEFADEPKAANWYPDPVGRFSSRWWDGSGWTDRVRRGTEELSDPLGDDWS